MDVAQLLWTAVTDHPHASLGLLVLVEGPAATVFGGSLVGAGLVAFWPILLIVVVADVTADSVLYLLGRLGARPRVARLLRRLGLTAVRHERLTAMINDDLPRVVAGTATADFRLRYRIRQCPTIGYVGRLDLEKNGHNGYLFPPGDSAALADRLIAVLSDHSHAGVVGRRSRALAEGHDIRATVGAFDSIYAEVTATSAPRLVAA